MNILNIFFITSHFYIFIFSFWLFLRLLIHNILFNFLLLFLRLLIPNIYFSFLFFFLRLILLNFFIFLLHYLRLFLSFILLLSFLLLFIRLLLPIILLLISNLLLSLRLDFLVESSRITLLQFSNIVRVSVRLKFRVLTHILIYQRFIREYKVFR